jgi:pyruvyltransferase
MRILSLPLRAWRKLEATWNWINFVFGDRRRPVRRKRVNVYYWCHPSGDNVGDLLSQVIVDFMLARSSIQPDATLRRTRRLFAIGSVLDAAKCGMTVWGSGLHHFGARAPRVRLDVRAVRGPLTRQALLAAGIPCPEVYGDPALLLPLFYAPKLAKKYPFTVIPHFSKEESYFNHYGDSVLSTLTSDWQSFVNRIIESELVISGSLHGIILAEAYGVRAILLSDIDTDWFKYEDYFLSAGCREVIKAESVEQALAMTVSEPPDLSELQLGLIASFPRDLWATNQ